MRDGEKQSDFKPLLLFFPHQLVYLVFFPNDSFIMVLILCLSVVWGGSGGIDAFKLEPFCKHARASYVKIDIFLVGDQAVSYSKVSK